MIASAAEQVGRYELLGMRSIALFTAAEAFELLNQRVVDETDEKVGEVDGFWLDASTARLEYLAVKTGWLFGKSHAVPSRTARWTGEQVQVPYTRDLLKAAPSFSPSAELSGIDKEEINSYYGQLFPGERITDLAEVRAEEARQQEEVQLDPNSPDLPDRSVPLPPAAYAPVPGNLAASDLTQQRSPASPSPNEKRE